MSSRYYSSRPSPPYSAAECAPGTRKRGNDGTMYTSVADKTGRLRWVKPRVGSPTRKRGAAAHTEPSCSKPDVGAYYTLRCTDFETGKHVRFRARCAASAVDEDGSGYEHTFDHFKKTLPEWLTQSAQVEGVLVFSQSATSFYKGLYAGDQDVSVDLTSV